MSKLKVVPGIIVLFLWIFLLMSAGKAEARSAPPWAWTTGSYRTVCAYEYCYYSYPDSDCYCYRYGFWLSQGFDGRGWAILDPDLSGCEIHQLVVGNRGLIITAKCPDGNKIRIKFSFCGGKKFSCLTYQGGNVTFTKNNEPYSSCSMASYGEYESSLSPRDEGSGQEESPQTISSLIRQMLSTE